MIAASIALAVAMYFSSVVVMGLVKVSSGIRSNVTGSAITAAIAWGLFYYFTHA